MNKTELVDAMSSRSGMSKLDSKKSLESLVESIKETLKGGDKISLIGFGTFSITDRAARPGVNPRTGEKIQIPASKVVKFKPGTELKETVNS